MCFQQIRHGLRSGKADGGGRSIVSEETPEETRFDRVVTQHYQNDHAEIKTRFICQKRKQEFQDGQMREGLYKHYRKPANERQALPVNLRDKVKIFASASGPPESKNSRPAI
jgi:ADP-heptose:LPS heptosyltransferase